MSRPLIASSVIAYEGLTVGLTEVQTLTVTGAPTGGTTTLTFSGSTTTALAWNAAAATVQAALVLLPTIGVGGVSCTGGPWPATPITVTFTGPLALRNVPAMTATPAFTGGTAPTLTVTTPTSGANGAITASSMSIIGGGSVLTIGNNDAAASALTINASTHPTSERAGMTMGTWLIGQDVAATGGLDFFVWNGATRLAIAATGAVSINSGINPFTVLRQGGTDEGGQIDFEGGTSYNPWTMDIWRNYFRLLYNGSSTFSIDSSGNMSTIGGATIPGVISMATNATLAYPGYNNRVRWTAGTGFTSSYAELGEYYSNTGDFGIVCPSGALHLGSANEMRFSAYSGDPRGSGVTLTASTFYGRYNVQIATQRNGGSGGLRATDNNYYSASFYVAPGDIAESQSGKTASIAFHPGGVAPQLRVGYGDPQIYNRDSVGTGNNPFTASAFNVASTRRIKKNIATWPSPALGAASERASEKLAKLRVVTFERNETHRKELPSGRRLEAWKRLNAYTLRNDLPAYELPDHDCSKHDCDGSAEDPCARHLNADHAEFGLIAEETFEVFPEAVVLDAGRLPASINYSMIEAVHLATTQELLERVKDIESRLAAV